MTETTTDKRSHFVCEDGTLIERHRWDATAYGMVNPPPPCPCPDCGTDDGDYHDWGCDVERCPACGAQLISCDCDWELWGAEAETRRLKAALSAAEARAVAAEREREEARAQVARLTEALALYPQLWNSVSDMTRYWYDLSATAKQDEARALDIVATMRAALEFAGYQWPEEATDAE